MRELSIAGRRIADDEPPYMVAEVGHNHQGSVALAKRIFDAAARAGADAVKLQKRDNRTLFTPAFYDSPYDSPHAFGATYGAHREALEFGWVEYTELKAYAESLNLHFFATAFDIPSADFLVRLGVPAIKIASGDLTNTPLLRYIAGLGIPVLLSTGGGAMADVDRAMAALDGTPAAILQCTAAYPCSEAALNLRVIETYRQRFQLEVAGISDHSEGITAAPAAVALGARVFEKHFTVDRTMKGSDQAFSLDEAAMTAYVNGIRGAWLALGDGVKAPCRMEAAPLRKMAKSPYWGPFGPVLQSPADGLPAWKIDKFSQGRFLREPLADGQVITSTGVLG